TSPVCAVAPPPGREPLDLTILMNEIIEDARLEAGAAEKSVDWSSPKEAMIVEGDHGLLRSAIENVLRNAVRFTKPSSAVKVRADRARPQGSLVIADAWPGRRDRAAGALVVLVVGVLCERMTAQ